MKKIAIFALCCVCFLAGYFYLHGLRLGQSSSSSEASKLPQLGFETRMKILESIPPMAGLEHDASDAQFYAKETADRDTLMTYFARFQNHNQGQGADPGANGLNRGTHAKGQCFNGTFTLLSDEEIRASLADIPDATREAMLTVMKQGFLSGHDKVSYPMSLRFANADGTGRIQPDGVGDVRGFSFAIEGVPTTDYTGEHRQDFMMNSTAAFACGEIHEFTDIVRGADAVAYTENFGPALKLILDPQAVRDLRSIDKANKAQAGIDSYASIPYWANLAYSAGADNAVKFRVVPCANTSAQPAVNKDDPNYLQSDIANRVQNGPTVCFEFQEQVFDIEALRKADPAHAQWSKTDWIENSGLLWDESKPGLAFRTVAKVEAHGAKLSTCTDHYINTRLHSNAANQPLGSIARVRTYVEEFSRARRMGEPLGRYESFVPKK